MPTAKSGSAKAKKTRKSPAKPAGRARTARSKAAPARKTTARKKAVRAKAPASGILGMAPGYVKALGEYEKAMEALQKRQFDRAAAMFQKLIDHHPNERDLVDRARIYVKTCQDQMREAEEPQGSEDLYYQGVFLHNRGEFREAIAQFEKALALDPGSDKVHYSLAASRARMGEREAALASLQRAIEMDGSIRVQARQDGDFQDLREDPAFEDLVSVEPTA